MKRLERLPSAPWGVFLGTLTAAAAMWCLSTGYALEMKGSSLILTCLVGAVLGCSLTVVQLGLLSFLLWAGVAALYWFYGDLSISLETLAATVSGFFANGYGTPVLRWSNLPLTDPTLALSLWGSLIAIALGRSVTRGKGTIGACLLGLSPLMVCMVLNDTVPTAAALFLLLAGLLMVLVPQSVRRRSPVQGSRLTTLLLIPLALAVAVLFLLNPRPGYDKQAGAQQLQDSALEAIQKILSQQEMPEVPEGEEFPGTIPELPWENLRLAGPRNLGSAPVMEVTAQETTVLYLRGRSFDTYTGTGWEVALDFHDSSFPTQSEFLTVQVNTLSPMDLMYLPYVGWGTLTEGCVSNTNGQTDYEVRYAPLNPGGTAPSGQDLSPYLQLPEDTASQISAFLPADPGPDPWAYAQAIAAFVQGSAAYSLDTEAMPLSADDFAVWFLSESDTGYCVHFASATAVLLRAAGIPARYVTGYAAPVVAGIPTVVTEEHAHAWVECYIEGTGWLMLESTPPDLGTGPEPTLPDPTRPTFDLPDFTPPASTDPTETTEATEATSPTGGADGPTLPTLPTLRPLPGWVTALLWILLLAGSTVGQWQLRLYLRRRKGAALKANALALHLWQQIEAHCRVRKTEPPEPLLTLAEKAKFSQHTITQEEIAAMGSWLEDSVKTFQSQPVYLQGLYTLIFALY